MIDDEIMAVVKLKLARGTVLGPWGELDQK
jgi:hypothetical protein